MGLQAALIFQAVSGAILAVESGPPAHAITWLDWLLGKDPSDRLIVVLIVFILASGWALIIGVRSYLHGVTQMEKIAQLYHEDSVLNQALLRDNILAMKWCRGRTQLEGEMEAERILRERAERRPA